VPFVFSSWLVGFGQSIAPDPSYFRVRGYRFGEWLLLAIYDFI